MVLYFAQKEDQSGSSYHGNQQNYQESREGMDHRSGIDYLIENNEVEQDNTQDVGEAAFVGYKFTVGSTQIPGTRNSNGTADNGKRNGIGQSILKWNDPVYPVNYPAQESAYNNHGQQGHKKGFTHQRKFGPVHLQFHGSVQDNEYKPHGAQDRQQGHEVGDLQVKQNRTLSDSPTQQEQKNNRGNFCSCSAYIKNVCEKQ